MKEEGCRISLVRRLLEQLESLALGVACSSTGRSGQSLQAQRETEAAGAARVAGGGCATSYRLGLQVQPKIKRQATCCARLPRRRGFCRGL